MICLTMALMTISCVDEEGEYVEGKRTRAGYLAYKFVGNSVFKQFELFTFAVHADEYMQATTDEERKIIDDLYFKKYKIQALNGIFIINMTGWEYNNMFCIFYSNGKPLNTIDNTWTISFSKNNEWHDDNPINYTIKCLEQGSYVFNGSLMIDNYKKKKDDFSDVTIKLLDDQNYALSGNGKYSYNENEFGDYVLSDIIINTKSIMSGSMDISFRRTNETKYEKAVITVDQEKDNSVKVEYRGLTEIWLPHHFR